MSYLDFRGPVVEQEVGMRRAVSAWVAGLAVIVLSGCSDPGQPSTTLPPLASSSAPASPTLAALGPADFPVPDEARVQTLDGAIAMARYFVQTLAYSQARLTGEWVRTFSEDCTTCDDVADGADEEAAAGNSYVGGELTLVDCGGELISPSSADLALVVDQAPLQVVGLECSR